MHKEVDSAPFDKFCTNVASLVDTAPYDKRVNKLLGKVTRLLVLSFVVES